MALSISSSSLLLSAALMLSASPISWAQDIYSPANDVEAKAQAVLEKHCARCHQDGKLVKREKPAKGFGNVLQLTEIAADPKRVVAGSALASPIFASMEAKKMPYDVYQEGDFEKPSPTAEDVEAIKTWINGLKVQCEPGKYDTKFIVNAMYQDLGDLPEHRRRNTRYLSLANLKASCASDEDMDIYRQGAIRLLNSLSTNSDVLSMNDSLVGDDKVIIRFNLDDLNWTPELWEYIISYYPYGISPFDSQYPALVSGTYTDIPYVRADWLAFNASRPPMYETILGLPDTFQALEHDLGLDTFKNIRNYLAKRAGFKESGVSQHNRLIERHPISTGYFWTSYDFAGTKTEQNLMEYPLGPIGAFSSSHGYGDTFAFRHDGGESIFSLPNGFQGYYLNNAAGKKLDKGPTTIVRDPARTDLAVTNGISCFGCHDQGMKNAVDEILDHTTENRLLPAEAREAVKALYPPKEEMDNIIAGDRKRFIDALERAGLDPKIKHVVDGEPVNALSNRYERDLDLNTAAGEFGVNLDDVEDRLRGGGQVGGSFASQLKTGTVQRDIFESEYANLLEFVVDGKYVAPGKRTNYSHSYGDGRPLQKAVAQETYDTPPKVAHVEQKSADANYDDYGFSVVGLSNDYRREHQLSEDSYGVVLSGFAAKSLASRAGLEAGDIIVEVGGREVEDASELSRAFERAFKAGKKRIVLLVEKHGSYGKRREVTLRLK